MMLHAELYQKFFQYNKKQPLEPTLYVLYMTLLEKWIENNCESFEISTSEIQKVVNMSRATINRAKPLLKEIGLIKYSSEKGGANLFTLVEIDIAIEVPKVEQPKEQPQVPKMEVPKIEQPLETTQENVVIVPELPKGETTKKEMLYSNSSKPIPLFLEVLTFAKTLKMYDNNMEPFLQSKYDSWVENGWRNGFDKPITNWKATIRNTIPHLMKNKPITPIMIPTIQRPVVTYDE